MLCFALDKRDEPFSRLPSPSPRPTTYRPPPTHLLAFTNQCTSIHPLTMLFASRSTAAAISSCRQPPLPSLLACMAAVMPPYTQTHTRTYTQRQAKTAKEQAHLLRKAVHINKNLTRSYYLALPTTTPSTLILKQAHLHSFTHIVLRIQVGPRSDQQPQAAFPNPLKFRGYQRQLKNKRTY